MFLSALEFLEKIMGIQFNDYFKMQPIGGYIGYFVLGYVLNKSSINRKITKYIYIVAIFSIMFIPFGTYILTKHNKGTLDSYFYEYTNPMILVISIAIFILVKNIDWDKILSQRRILLKTIINISNNSFGIYLIHPLVMGILVLPNLRFTIFNEKFNPLYRIPIMDFTVFIISYFIIKLLQKLRYTKLMIP